MLWLRIAIIALFAWVAYSAVNEDIFEDNWFKKLQRKLHKDVCLQPPSYGKCKGHRRLWYFNGSRKKCETFIYSNCGGNHNRFYNYEECHNFCQKQDAATIYKSIQMNDWAKGNIK